MTFVCVVIPVAAKHLVWLNQCVQSVLAQTLRPSHISIYVSGAPCPVFQNPLISCNHSRVPRFAGAMRNRAVNQCRKDSEYISSIDADDLMMPYALERMIEIMKKENATVGLHGYSHHADTIIPHDELHHKNLVKDQYPPMKVSAHHGHITVARTQWLPQKEEMKRGQDSEHVIRLWKSKNRFVYTKEKLTSYIKRPLSRVPRSGRFERR